MLVEKEFMSSEDQIIAYYITITCTCWIWFNVSGLMFLVLREVFCNLAKVISFLFFFLAKVISEETVNEKDKMVQDISLAFSYQGGTN